MPPESAALILAIEPLMAAWNSGGQQLAEEEWRELGQEGPFRPDLKGMVASEAAGILRVLVARSERQMIGYLSWMIDFDLEEVGALIAYQCAWFVAPGHYGVASAMFDWATEYLKELGVRRIHWHHPTVGRGAKMGPFFARRGAVHTQCTYTMRF